ncbi:MAG: hypothetical protein ACI38A_07205 [Candidatus Ornithomonoglobus sp.]
MDSETKTVTAEDINNMSEEEFAQYLAELDTPDDVPEEASEPPEDAAAMEGNTEPGANGEPAEGTAEPSEIETEPPTSEPAQHETQPELTTTTIGQGLRAEKLANGSASTQDDTLSRIKRAFTGNYGDAGDNWADALINQLDEAAANERGVPVGEYKKQQTDNAELERYRNEERQRKEQQDNQNRIITRWQNESATLKQLDPSFDFGAATQNETFKNVLMSGGSVAQAYLASGMNKSPEAVEPQKQQPEPPIKRREISQNAQTAARGTGDSTVNPASLPTKDFLAYINKRKNS